LDAAGNEFDPTLGLPVEEVSATPFAKVTVWTLQDSWDENLLQWCSPGPVFTGTAEGTQHDLTQTICDTADPLNFCAQNGGDWQLGPDAADGDITYGFGENAANLDGGGGSYDGMLISDPIYVSQTQTTIHLWRNVDLRQFDLHSVIPPDTYYLEIRNDIGDTILATIESWESPANHTDYNDIGVIEHNITALRGQIIRVMIQMVGHSGADCGDGGGDDGLVQISDVYIN